MCQRKTQALESCKLRSAQLTSSGEIIPCLRVDACLDIEIQILRGLAKECFLTADTPH